MAHFFCSGDKKDATTSHWPAPSAFKFNFFRRQPRVGSACGKLLTRSPKRTNFLDASPLNHRRRLLSERAHGNIQPNRISMHQQMDRTQSHDEEAASSNFKLRELVIHSTCNSLRGSHAQDASTGILRKPLVAVASDADGRFKRLAGNRWPMLLFVAIRL